MARTVFVHIGLPKTGTTYLQTILWSNTEALADQGLLIPGEERRDHLWSARIIREESFRNADERRRTAWERVRAAIGAWSGDALFSHEFLSSATLGQIRTMVQQLAPARVEVVITAREPLSLFTSSWQESLKNRATAPIETYSRKVSADPRAVWNWRSLDLGLVLERWAKVVPADQIAVIAPPGPGEPRSALLERYCTVLGVDPDRLVTTRAFANSSLGVVEAETLRRINRHLGEFQNAFDRGVYVRSFLADERLAVRDGEPFWPGPERIEECRRRDLRTRETLERLGVRVLGDPAMLQVPAHLTTRRTPDTVSEAEVSDVAVELVARMLADVRELRIKNAELTHRLHQAERGVGASGRARLRRGASRLRRGVRRLRDRGR